MLILLQDMKQVSLSKQKQAKERKVAHHFHIQVQRFTHRKIKSCKMWLFGGGGVQMIDVFLLCVALTKTASSQHKYACNKLDYYFNLYACYSYRNTEETLIKFNTY